MSAAEIRVEWRGVVKRFGSVVAVDDVALGVRAGEFLTLLGPSGCGKTTLLRMVSGFERPDLGEVWLDGREVTELPPYRRDVNQVFQSYALFPHLSVRGNVEFGLRMKGVGRGERESRVAEVIEMVGMGGMEGRKPSQLSGGQRQRVALARAIVCRPRVLLLDEPLAALDAKLRGEMQVELKRLQKRVGITFVFVTHDQEEAMTMSDRVAVINKGKVEQVGATAHIYDRPATPFVAAFLGMANVLSGEVLGVKGRWSRVRLGDGTEIWVEGIYPAGRVTVTVRPEKVGVSWEESKGAFACVVKEELFRGAFDQLVLRTRGGLELTAVVVNAGVGHPDYRVGDVVWCDLRAEDVIVLRDGEGKKGGGMGWQEAM